MASRKLDQSITNQLINNLEYVTSRYLKKYCVTVNVTPTGLEPTTTLFVNKHSTI